MPRTKTIVRKAGPALRSAPIPGAGVVRKTKRKSTDAPFQLALAQTDRQERHDERREHHVPPAESAQVRQADGGGHVRGEERGADGGGEPVEEGLDGAGEGD